MTALHAACMCKQQHIQRLKRATAGNSQRTCTFPKDSDLWTGKQAMHARSLNRCRPRAVAKRTAISRAMRSYMARSSSDRGSSSASSTSASSTAAVPLAGATQLARLPICCPRCCCQIPHCSRGCCCSMHAWQARCKISRYPEGACSLEKMAAAHKTGREVSSRGPGASAQLRIDQGGSTAALAHVLSLLA